MSKWIEQTFKSELQILVEQYILEALVLQLKQHNFHETYS